MLKSPMLVPPLSRVTATPIVSENGLTVAYLILAEHFQGILPIVQHGKSDRASLDSFGRWDKVALITQKKFKTNPGGTDARYHA
jgi:hypothetical protein